jgi:hypothetical protein
VTKLTFAIVLMGLPAVLAAYNSGGGVVASGRGTTGAVQNQPRQAKAASSSRVANPTSFRTSNPRFSVSHEGNTTTVGFRFGRSPNSTSTSTPSTTSTTTTSNSKSVVINNENEKTTINEGCCAGGWFGGYGYYGGYYYPPVVGVGFGVGVGVGFYTGYYPGPYLYPDVAIGYRTETRVDKKVRTGLQIDLGAVGKYKKYAEGGNVEAWTIDEKGGRWGVIGDIHTMSQHPRKMDPGVYDIRFTFKQDGREVPATVVVTEGTVTSYQLVFTEVNRLPQQPQQTQAAPAAAQP